MTESLLELKKKISSIQKTGQITEAMRMVSGVKLNRTEKLNQAYTVYNLSLIHISEPTRRLRGSRMPSSA